MLDRKKVYEQLRAVLVNTVEVAAVLLKDACNLGLDLQGEIKGFEEARRLSNMFVRTSVEGIDPTRFNHILSATSEFYYSLRNRVAKLLRCPSFILWMEGRIEAASPNISDQDARALRIELRAYITMVKDQESFAVLRAAMVGFCNRLSGLEMVSVETSIARTLAAAPAASKPDRKRDKRLRDGALRSRMKGSSEKKELKADSKKSAMRARKAGQKKGLGKQNQAST